MASCLVFSCLPGASFASLRDLEKARFSRFHVYSPSLLTVVSKHPPLPSPWTGIGSREEGLVPSCPGSPSGCREGSSRDPQVLPRAGLETWAAGSTGLCPVVGLSFFSPSVVVCQSPSHSDLRNSDYDRWDQKEKQSPALLRPPQG